LKDGHHVVAFLEGTSTGNDCVLPLKASLLEAAVKVHAPIIPVGIRWRAHNTNICIKEDVAYWKDHIFAKHAWRLMGLQGIFAEISFGKPISSVGISRGTIRDRLQREIENLTGLGQAVVPDEKEPKPPYPLPRQVRPA